MKKQMRLPVAMGLATALFGGAACNLISGAGAIDFGATGGGGSTGSTSSGTGGARPACTCVDAVPAGWTGYVALYDGADAQKPACDGAFPTMAYTGHDKLVAPDATCSQCTCTAPTGATCHAVKGGIVSPAPCDADTTLVIVMGPTPWDGSCYAAGVVGGGMSCDNAGKQVPCNQRVNLETLVFDRGTCSASTQVASVAPVSWDVAGVACSPAKTPDASCADAGATCFSTPGAPFGVGLCIQQTGDVACPAGAFSERHVFHESATDDRSCTSCGCDDASGGSCSATAKYYSGATCTGTPVAKITATSASAGCGNLAGNPQVQAREAAFTLTPAACPATGGKPSGSATATLPTTFCCVP